jgi:hypothetical protein
LVEAGRAGERRQGTGEQRTDADAGSQQGAAGKALAGITLIH